MAVGHPVDDVDVMADRVSENQEVGVEQIHLHDGVIDVHLAGDDRLLAHDLRDLRGQTLNENVNSEDQ